MSDDPAKQLQEQGVAVLRDILARDSLTRLRDAAERCFEAISRDESPPANYRFNRFSNSMLTTALMDFGCSDEQELTLPLTAPSLEALFSEAIGSDWTCNLEQSWLRKKFAPSLAPAHEYHPQGWHQDGALGVSFSAQPGQPPPMTELLTCWIPLNPCGVDSPGLEFIRRPQQSLLHFTELDDEALRRRFLPDDFCAPQLEFGDGLVFLNSVLHRTHTNPKMSQNRLSIEYRLFPPEAAERSSMPDTPANKKRKNS